jgi:hypothetical protein
MSFLDGIPSVYQHQPSSIYLSQHNLHPLHMLLDDPLRLDLFFLFSTTWLLSDQASKDRYIPILSAHQIPRLVLQGWASSQSEETRGNTHTHVNTHKQRLKVIWSTTPEVEKSFPGAPAPGLPSAQLFLIREWGHCIPVLLQGPEQPGQITSQGSIFCQVLLKHVSFLSHKPTSGKVSSLFPSSSLSLHHVPCTPLSSFSSFLFLHW